MKLARQVSSLLVARAAVIGLTFLSGLIVARVVGPSGKGVLTVLTSFVTLVSVVAGFGFAAGAVPLHKTKRYSIGTIVGASTSVWLVTLTVGVLLVSVGGQPLLRTLLSIPADQPLEPAWLWLSFATLPGLLLSGLMQSLWLVDGRTRLYTAATLGSQFVSLGLVCLLVVAWPWGVTGALVANLGAQMLALVIGLGWLRSLGEPGRFKVVRAALGPIVRASQGAYWNGIAANIFKHGEALLLAVLLDLRSVGQYGIALTFYQLLTEVPRTVVWPLVGRLSRGDAPTAELAARSLRVIPVALLLPLIGVAAAVPFLIPAIYGQPFAPSGALLAAMAPGMLFRSIHLVVYSYLVLVGRLDRIIGCVAVTAAANLGIDLLVVPRWGLGGVAISNLISEAVLAVLSVAVFLKETGLTVRHVLPGRADLADLWRQVLRMTSR